MRLIITALAFLAAVAARAVDTDGIAITTENGIQKVSAPGYELRISPAGYPTSLQLRLPGEVSGTASNCLKIDKGSKDEPLVGGSSGAYFYQNGVIALNPAQPEGSHAIVAQGDRASIRYEFKPGEMTWTLTNKTDQPMQFFIVLDRTVNAVMSSQGQVEKTPALQLWPVTTWFQGNRKLHISGGDRIWGPNEILAQVAQQRRFQVWEATLQPKEDRTVTLTPSVATDDELATIAGLAPEKAFRPDPIKALVTIQPAADGDLRVFSPHDYQVFQRQTRHQGNVLLDGDIKPGMEKIEYRVTGTSTGGTLPGEWHPLPLNPLTHSFRTVVAIPAGGWYQIEFRASKAGGEKVTASLAHVGVGEVFVIAGQSTNTGSDKIKPESGMVSTFSGTGWRLAEDPQPGANDITSGGSPWPALGDALYAKYKVPIAVAVTGEAGTSVMEWRSGNSGFDSLMRRIGQLHPEGFRAVLWDQGESDASRSGDDYFETLSSTIAASYAMAHWKFPWFVAEASYTSPKTASSPAIRGAQQQLWTKRIALEGPDKDTLTGDYRSGMNLNAKGLKRHGELWAEKVSVYLDRVLEHQGTAE